MPIPDRALDVTMKGSASTAQLGDGGVSPVGHPATGREPVPSSGRAPAVTAAFWSTAAYYATRLLSLASVAVLSRLLTPREFGLAGLAFVVLTFLDAVRDGGMGPAVIYVDDEQAAHTAFWTGLLAGTAGCAMVWLTAPALAQAFHEPRVATVIRVLALALPISALGNIHDSLLARQLAFRRRMVSDTSVSATRAVSSVAFAFAGMGAWSLVMGHLLGLAVGVVVLWRVQRWRPAMQYSLPLARRLLRYGGATVSLNGLAKFLVNADYLFIGRYLGASALGLYTLAFRVPELLIGDFCAAIGKVAFPAYARITSDVDRVAKGVLAMTRYVALIMVPMGLGLACVAKPMVLVVLGERWRPAVEVTRAIALQSVLLAVTYNIGDVYKATGRLSLLTRLAALRALLLLPALWWTAARVGTIEAVAWTHVGIAALLVMVELSVAAAALGTPLRAFWSALSPALTSATIMVAVVVALLSGIQQWSPLLQLLTAVTVGVVAYVGALFALHRPVLVAARTLVARPRRTA